MRRIVVFIIMIIVVIIVMFILSLIIILVFLDVVGPPKHVFYNKYYEINVLFVCYFVSRCPSGPHFSHSLLMFFSFGVPRWAAKWRSEEHFKKTHLH